VCHCDGVRSMVVYRSILVVRLGSWAAGLLAPTAWAALTPSSNTLEQGRQSITPLCARCSLETTVPRTSPSLLD